MAHEAYRSLYGDLGKLKDDSLIKDPASGTGDDDELFQLLLSVSDWVDHYCNRDFYWPASVERAALIQTSGIWTRSADFEPFFVDADLDTDVRLLLKGTA